MSVLEVKNDLLRLVVETNDPELLDKVRNYFKILKEEPVSQNEMDEQELRMIEKGLKQVENGETHSHEDVRQKIRAFLHKK